MEEIVLGAMEVATIFPLLWEWIKKKKYCSISQQKLHSTFVLLVPLYVSGSLTLTLIEVMEEFFLKTFFNNAILYDYSFIKQNKLC